MKVDLTDSEIALITLILYTIKMILGHSSKYDVDIIINKLNPSNS